MTAPRAQTQRSDQTDHAPRKAKGLLRLAALVALVCLFGAACSSSSDDDSASTQHDSGSEDADFGDVDAMENAAMEEPAMEELAMDDAAMADEAMEEAAVAGEAEGDDETFAQSAQDDDGDDGGGDGEAEGSLGSGGAAIAPTAADIGRKLIFTAFLNVEVDDVAVASVEATSIVEGMGGFLFGQNTVGGAEPSSELTFKILPDDFSRALDALGSVGELRNQSVTTDDVTERIVDLESRIEVAALGVARLRAALEGSASLEDYAQIERLLLDRESDLEVMRGQLRTLEDRVDLATITLLLTQDRVHNGIEVLVSTYEGYDDGVSCPGQGNWSVGVGSEVTVCFDIVNVGDQTLTQIALTDTALEIDAETQLIEVFGTLDTLAPGQSVLVAHQISPQRDLRTRTRVVAIPTDGVTADQVGPSVSAQVNTEIRTFASDGSPGFSDGFGVAIDLLKAIWVAVVVTIGFLLPLLILTPFVWLAWRGWRAWRKRRPAKPSSPSRPGPGGDRPPPPAPAATAVRSTAKPEAEADAAPHGSTTGSPEDASGSD